MQHHWILVTCFYNPPIISCALSWLNTLCENPVKFDFMWRIWKNIEANALAGTSRWTRCNTGEHRSDNNAAPSSAEDTPRSLAAIRTNMALIVNLQASYCGLLPCDWCLSYSSHDCAPCTSDIFYPAHVFTFGILLIMKQQTLHKLHILNWSPIQERYVWFLN